MVTAQLRESSDKYPCRCIFFGTFFQKTHLSDFLYISTATDSFANSWCFTFTGKEKDEETGYGYFGARYLDHDLTGMWLSVDPMMDKYPNVSPYNYCMWNPIKMIDPDGRDTFYIELNQGKIFRREASGNHCIQFRKDGVFLSDRTITGIESRLEYDADNYWENDEYGSGNTIYLKFEDANLGRRVFNIIETECSYSNSAKEWDYYYLESGGELSSSARENVIGHAPYRYTEYNVREWHHFHPRISDQSWFPSTSDQERSRYLKVPCYLHWEGNNRRFDSFVRGHNLTPPDYCRKLGIYK